MEGYNVIAQESKITPGLHVYKKKVDEAESHKTIRVAAYCRVSTDLEIQKSSLDIQMKSYKRIIKEHQGWKLAGIYADKGITGTSVKKRAEFQRMITDAENGKIDYIIAKSTSRFARNTVDTLSYTRHLRDIGVGVYFEEQKIDTLSITSEMLLTIHAAFAQEESHSISENLKRGYRSRFQMGIPKWSNTYGYRRVDGDVWEPDEKEAEVVKTVFELYNEGMSLPEICRLMEENSVSSPGEGNGGWYAHSLSTILHNEKYIGDVAMQKAYTIDHITHKKVDNRDATLPRYYKTDHHPAIVSKEVFDMTQTILAMKDRHKGAIQYPFYGTLRCPYCNEKMISVRLPSRYHEQAWICGGKENGETEIRKRTSCPPFCIKSKYIHRGVKAAAEEIGNAQITDQVEYKFLIENVQSISFKKNKDTVDFNTLEIVWKNGRKSTADITYDRASEIPVTKESAVLKDDGYYANGVWTNGTINAYKSIQQLFDFIEQVQVIDIDREDQANIPDVLTPGGKKEL